MRLCPLAVLALAVPSIAAPAPAAAQEAAGAKVYKQAVPSVVWVHSARKGGLATGSGSLVDRGRRLVLTNYHVVEDNPKATVFFPQFRDGQPIPERQFYQDRARRLGIPGTVVALDKSADLAVIRIDSVPDDAPGIPLAANSPGPGESVQSIGNAGKSGALWGYVRGTVRQVYNHTWRAKLGSGRVATFRAKVIETDSATNPGDSGGPLLNDKAELVGVVQGGAIDAQLVSTFVDLSEVKQLLSGRSVTGTAPPPPVSPEARRDKPLPVADRAKLFTPDGLKAAEAGVADLYKKGVDLLVETYPAAPDEWADAARKADPAERKRLFREWATARLNTEKARGLAVIVCQDPRYIAVEVGPEVEDRFPPGFGQTMADALIRAFKEKKFDAGLADAVRLVGENVKGDRK